MSTKNTSFANRRLIPEDVRKLNYLSTVDLSLDGKRAAYVKTHTCPETDLFESHIYMYDFKRGVEKQFTFHGSIEINPRFSPDGNMLAFISNRSGSNQIWVFDLINGGDARCMTSMRFGVSDITWSPDSRKIAFISCFSQDDNKDTLQTIMTPAEEANEKWRSKYAPRYIDKARNKLDEAFGLLDGKHKHIWVTDIFEETTALLTKDDFDHNYPCWSPDGSELYFASNQMDEYEMSPFLQDIYKVSAKGGDIVKLTEKCPLASAAPLKITNDGKYIIFCHAFEEEDKSAVIKLAKMPSSGGNIISLFPGGEVCDGLLTLTAGGVQYGDSYECFYLGSCGEYAYFLSSWWGAVNLYRAKIEGEPEIIQIINLKHTMRGFCIPRDGKIVYLADTMENPTELYV